MAATLRLRRTKTYTDSLLTYSLDIDGLRVGDVAQGEVLEVEVEPGDRELSLSATGFTKPIIETFTFVDDEVLALKCGSPIHGWKLFLSTIFAFQAMLGDPRVWRVIEHDDGQDIT